MKENLIRTVIAQYLGNNQESLDVPWMDYVQKKTDESYTSQNSTTPDSKNPPKQVSDPRGNGDVGPALIDGLIDPMSMGKKQDGPNINENDAFRSDGDSQNFPIGFNTYDRNDTPETSLKWWWDSRNRQDESTGNVWGSNLYGQGVNVSTREASMKTASTSKTAFKNLHQILETSTHPKTEEFKNRGKSLTPQKVGSPEQEKKGLYEFKVSGDGESNTVKIQFLKAQGETSNLLDHPCQVACDCNSFLFWGPQYYAIKSSYMFLPMSRPQIIAPKSKDEGGRGKGLTFCKHIYAVSTHLSEMGVDEAYSDDIKNQLLDIKDTPSSEVAEEMLTKYHLGRKTKFKQFLEDSELHDEVYREGLKLLKSNGLDEHQLADYVTGDFSNQDTRTQELVLEGLGGSPDILILLLLEYKKVTGSVPVSLIDTAYTTIKDKISWEA